MSLTDKQKNLIVVNYGLLKDYVIKTINNGEIPKNLEDEFISDSFFSFCISAQRFEEERKFKFSTYAYGGFRLWTKNVLSYKREKIERTYYYADLNHNYVKNHRIDRIEPCKLEIDDLNEFVESSNLSNRERDMLESYYYSKLTFSQIAKSYGLSGEMVRLIVRGALKKLKCKADDKRLGISDFYG